MVLGIDPGLASCGWAVLPNAQTLSSCGCITTKKEVDLAFRLSQLYREVFGLCRQYQIKELAIESVFFAKNTKTAFLVAQAMGVIKAAAAQAEVSVFEYTPLRIKIAVTGYGRAEKSQVTEMVCQSLGENEQLANDHVADAAAAALTHLVTLRKEDLVE